jgi:hypothetical protein
MMSQFELNLEVTQSQSSTYSPNNKFLLDLHVSQSYYYNQTQDINLTQSTYQEDHSWCDKYSSSSSQSSLFLSLFDDTPQKKEEKQKYEDFYDPKFEILSKLIDEVSCRKIQRCYRGFKHRKRVRIFSKKMKARRRLGSANVIKRCIVKKGMQRRSTTGGRLYRLCLIKDKLQKKKSIYY